MTTLSRQLQRLALPETAIYKQTNRAASLLFEPEDAAGMNKDTIFAIALVGFEELVSNDNVFEQFRATLFDQSTLDVERALFTRDQNVNLDAMIGKFFVALTPYVLFSSAHKAIEWLVRCFRVHQYNVDAVLRCALHYHDCNIFARILKLLEIRQEHSLWHWLLPFRQSAKLVTRQALCRQCEKDPALMTFILDTASLWVQFAAKHGAHTQQIVFKFHLSLCWTTIAFSDRLTNTFLNSLFPYLVKGLKSRVVAYKLCSYGIIARLGCKAELERSVSKVLVQKILKTMVSKSSFFGLTAVVVLFETQAIEQISASAVKKVAVKEEDVSLIENLLLLMEEKCIDKFLQPFLKTLTLCAIEEVTTSSEESHCSDCLLKCVNMIPLSTEIAKMLLLLFSKQYVSLFTTDRGLWQRYKVAFGKMVRRLCCRYAAAYDSVSVLFGKKKVYARHAKKLQAWFNFGMPKKLRNYEELLVCLHHPNRKTRTLALARCLAALDSPNVSESAVELIERGIFERLNCNDLHVLETFLRKTQELAKVFSKERMVQTLHSLALKLEYEEETAPYARACLASLASIVDESVVRSCEGIAPFLLSGLWAHESNSGENIVAIFESEFARAIQIHHLTEDVKKLIEFDAAEKRIHFNRFIVISLSNWLLSDGELKFKEKMDILLRGVSSKHMMPGSTSLFVLVLCHSSSNCKDAWKGDKLCWAVDHCWHELVVRNLKCPEGSASPLGNRNFLTPTCYPVMRKICFDVPRREMAVTKDLIAIVTSSSSQLLCLELVLVLGVHLLDRKWDKAHMQASVWWTGDKSKEAAEIVLYLCLAGKAEQQKEQCNVEWIDDFTTHLFSVLEFDVELYLKLLPIAIAESCLHTIAPDILLFAERQFNTSSGSDLAEISFSSSPAVPIAFSVFGSSLTDVRRTAGQLVATWSELLRNSDVERGPYFLLLDFLNFICNAVNMDAGYLPQALLRLTEKGSTGVRPLIEVMNFLFDYPFMATEPLAVDFMNSVCLCFDQEFSTRAFFLFNRLLKGVIDGTHKVPPGVLYAFLNRYCTETADLVTTDSDALEALLACFQSDELCERAILVVNNAFFTKLSSKVQEKLLNAMIDLCKGGARQKASKAAKVALAALSIDPDFVVRSMETLLLSCEELAKGNEKKRRKIDQNLKMNFGDATVLLEALNSNDAVPSSVELTSQLFEVLKLLQRTDSPEKSLLKAALLLLLRIFEEANEVVPCDVEVLVGIFCQKEYAEYQEIVLRLFQEWSRLLGPSAVDIVHLQFFSKKGVPNAEDALVAVKQLDKILVNVVPAVISAAIAVSAEDAEKAVVSIFVALSSVTYENIIRCDSWIAVLKKLVEMIDLILSANEESANGHLWQLLVILIVRHVKGRWKHEKDFILAKNVDGPLLEMSKRLSSQFPAAQLLKMCDDLLKFLVDLQHPKRMEGNFLANCDFWQRPIIAKLLNPIKTFIIELIGQLFDSDRLKEQFALLPKCRQRELAPCFETMTEKIFAVLSWLESGATGNVFRKSLRSQCVTCLERITSLYPPGVSLKVIPSLVDHKSEFVKICALQVLSSRLRQAEATVKLGNEEDLVAVLNSLNNSFSASANSPEQQVLYRASLIAIKSICSEVKIADMPAILQAVANVSNAMHAWNDLDANSLCITVLCLGELVKCASNQCFPLMGEFMEDILNLLDSGLMSKASVRRATLAAARDILGTLPNFISPYLARLICAFGKLEGSFHSARPPSDDGVLLEAVAQQCSSLDGRFLLAAVSEALDSFPATAQSLPFLCVLLKNFLAQCSSQYVSAQRATVSRLFLQALDCCNGPDVEIDLSNRLEDLSVDAMVQYAMKLTEGELASFVDTLLGWSFEQDDRAERVIAVFKLANALVDRLKTLFLSFAGAFATVCETLLDRCNLSKGDGYFSKGSFRDLKRKQLVCTLLMWFKRCCELGSDDQINVFLTSSRFDSFKDPVVDQIENTAIPDYRNFVSNYVVPCISCMVIAAADDSLRRQLSYAVLMKSRDPNPQVRLSSLLAFGQLLKTLNEEAVGLVPEAVQFLSELMEDECEEVEQLCHEVVKSCEGIIGESLQTYF
uniref:HEAT repeat-containing protein 1 n=1 Tax=Trichuris muris TaxID=70415 RepID=A0A5S6QQ31_TRIMR